MHIQSVYLKDHKRFTELTVELPEPARLVMMAGPNGSGKSSFLEGLRLWLQLHAGTGWSGDLGYYSKTESTVLADNLKVTFFEDQPLGEDIRRSIYGRTAYRHEADFTSGAIAPLPEPSQEAPMRRMIDSDQTVASNYQRLIASVVDIFNGQYADMTGHQIVEALIGPMQHAVHSLFPDLDLLGPADPFKEGTFRFNKGASFGFRYKNLSAGEKAAFDLILDIVVKRDHYSGAVYFIDEPEIHSSPRLQAKLLDVLLEIIPPDCQLWLATHSIGIMRRALEINRSGTASVAFLDFDKHNFDAPVTMLPVKPSRDFWKATLRVALDDIAGLVAPSTVVLCEGNAAVPGMQEGKAAFDAECYRMIFGEELAEVDFASVGNSHDVENDRLRVGATLNSIVGDTKVVRLIDRDGRSDVEIADHLRSGVRVLGRRHLECYLLDDEVISALAEREGKVLLAQEAIDLKMEAIADSVARGNPADDVKSAAGQFFTDVKVVLQLHNPGGDTRAFLRDTMAPLLTTGMATYHELKQSVFPD